MNVVEGLPFDAAPFGQPLPEGNGWRWEDLRELHRVTLVFREKPPQEIRLQYWLTSWPHRRLPKDHVPEGGSVGWWGLGDWFTGRWQTADTSLLIEEDRAIFTFRPLNEREFPDMTDLPATYRTTFQIRWLAEELPPLERIEAHTDSVWASSTLTVLWRSIPSSTPIFETFNGHISSVRRVNPRCYRVTLWRTRNPDPNSFDRTLLTVHSDSTFTVAIDDLDAGPVYLPDYDICVVKGEEERDFTGLVAAIRVNSPPSLYDLISELPEQSWERAWRNMVPKRGRLYLPLGMDGGRQRTISSSRHITATRLKISSAIGSIGAVFHYRADWQTNATDILHQIHCSGISLKGALEWVYPTLHSEGTRHSIERNTKIAMKLIMENRLKVDPLLSHVIKPERIKSAYEGLLNRKDEFIGVVIDWSEE